MALVVVVRACVVRLAVMMAVEKHRVLVRGAELQSEAQAVLAAVQEE